MKNKKRDKLIKEACDMSNDMMKDRGIEKLRKFFSCSVAVFEMMHTLSISSGFKGHKSYMHQLHLYAKKELEKEEPNLIKIDTFLEIMEDLADANKREPRAIQNLKNMKRTCENCEHSKKLDCYKKEHELGLIFCQKIKYIDETMEVEAGRMHVFDGDNGEGVGNNVLDYVHKDYGCINFKKIKET